MLGLEFSIDLNQFIIKNIYTSLYYYKLKKKKTILLRHVFSYNAKNTIKKKTLCSINDEVKFWFA